MRVGVTILCGERAFAWRPVRLEDGRVAWLRFVHRLVPICGLRPVYGERPARFTDRIPHCPSGLLITPTGGRLVEMITRSEEHTSELQSLMRISYAVFCLKKKKKSERLAHCQ